MNNQNQAYMDQPANVALFRPESRSGQPRQGGTEATYTFRISCQSSPLPANRRPYQPPFMRSIGCRSVSAALKNGLLTNSS